MIITKELSNINHIFENCAKLTEFSINEDRIITDNEFEDEDKDKYFNFYNNCDDDNNIKIDFYQRYYSECSEIRESNNSNKSQIANNYKTLLSFPSIPMLN